MAEVRERERERKRDQKVNHDNKPFQFNYFIWDAPHNRHNFLLSLPSPSYTANATQFTPSLRKKNIFYVLLSWTSTEGKIDGHLTKLLRSTLICFFVLFCLCVPSSSVLMVNDGQRSIIIKLSALSPFNFMSWKLTKNTFFLIHFHSPRRKRR